MRSNAAHRAVAVLRVAQVAHILFVKRLAVHIEHRAAHENLRVARPAQPLVALRTVGGHADKVSALPPHYVLIKFVHHFVRAGKLARLFKVGVHDFARDELDFRFAVRRNLHIPKAVEREQRTKFLAIAAGGNINVGGFGTAQVFRIDRAVRTQHFAVAERQPRARSRRNARGNHAHHVLSEVVHRVAVLVLIGIYRVQAVLDGDNRLARELRLAVKVEALPRAIAVDVLLVVTLAPVALEPVVGGNRSHRFPRRIVIVWRGKIPDILAHVVIRAQNLARRCQPTVVGHDFLAAAVRILDVKLRHDENAVAVVAAVHVVAHVSHRPAVACHQADCVLLSQPARHVKLVNRQPLAVVGKARGHVIVRHRFAVQVRLHYAHRAQPQHGALRLARKRKRLAKVRRGIAVTHQRALGLARLVIYPICVKYHSLCPPRKVLCLR